MKKLLISMLAMTILVATAEAKRNQNREHNQQSRIKQGVKSGSLTHHEAKKLRKGQKHIDHIQKKAMSDGKMTFKEKARIEKAQDHQSKLIYKEKHDDQNRKPKESPADQNAPPSVTSPETPATE